jgi:hypothetical protein
MSVTYKFGYVDAAGSELPYQYKNIWARENTSGPERLVIVPASGYIDLLSKLSTVMSAPYFLLYVLQVPRSEVAAGRYQNPEPISRDELISFLRQFGNLIEGDGRHHFWMGSADKSSLLVYDRHQVIYAYGQLETFEAVLDGSGLQQTTEVRFPEPHVHRYNQEFDQQAADLMDYWQWKQFPLQDSDL